MHSLYVMRHGQAESMAPTDAQRALTDRGKRDAFACASTHLKDLHFHYVFVSPYLRAQQTFEQVKLAGIQFDQMDTVDWITPDVSTQPALDELIALPGDNLNVLLVCHQTFAGRLVTKLTEGHEYGLHLNTASIACIKTPVFASQCADFIGVLA